MYITSAGSRSRLLIANTGIDVKFRREINEKLYKWSIQQTPIKHHRIVIADVGLQYR